MNNAPSYAHCIDFIFIFFVQFFLFFVLVFNSCLPVTRFALLLL